MKRLRCISAAVMVALVISAMPAAAQQVTEQVPSEALVVIKIRNLQDVSKKMAALAQQFGIAAMNPAASDPLGAFQQQTGISQGLNANGDAAIIFMEMPKDAVQVEGEVGDLEDENAADADAQNQDAENLDAEDEDEPEEKAPLLMLLPVSDYQAFLKNFGEARNEGDLAIVNFKGQEKDVYVADWGGYAAISDRKEYLAQKAKGLKVGGVTGKELQTKDITVYANMDAIRARVLPKLQQNRENILAEIERGITEQGQTDPKYVPVIKTAVGQALNIAEQFLKEAQAGTYGIQLSDAGITTTAMAEFSQGSNFGNTVSQLKGSGDSMLTGLPQGQYLMYGGAVSNPEVTLEFINNLIGPVEKELAGLGAEGQAIQKYLQSLRQYMGAVKATRFGMIAPSGQLGQEAIIQSIGISHGDAEAMSAAYKQMLQQSEELMGVFGAENVQAKTVVTEDAKTVDGVSLDMFQTKFGGGAGGANPDAEDDAKQMQAQQMDQMMTLMYGPEGLRGYLGVVDGKLVQAANVSDQMLQTTIQSAKADEKNLSGQPGVSATRKQLPQNRLAEVYLPLDVMLNTAATYASAFGTPVKLQLPPNLPPIGFTMGTEGTAFRVDSHVPAQLVQSVVAAGMQAFMQMQQGGQPGGPNAP